MPVCGRRKEPAALATALRRTTLAPELRRPRNPTITCDYWGSQAMSRHRGAWFHAARSRNPQEHNVDAETSRNSIPQPIERREPIVWRDLRGWLAQIQKNRQFKP